MSNWKELNWGAMSREEEKQVAIDLFLEAQKEYGDKIPLGVIARMTELVAHINQLKSRQTIMREALEYCDRYFKSQDEMNAAKNCEEPRPSKITEKVALSLRAARGEDLWKMPWEK